MYGWFGGGCGRGKGQASSEKISVEFMVGAHVTCDGVRSTHIQMTPVNTHTHTHTPISCSTPYIQGYTALHWAFKWGTYDKDVIVALLKHKGDPNCQDNEVFLNGDAHTSTHTYMGE